MLHGMQGCKKCSVGQFIFIFLFCSSLGLLKCYSGKLSTNLIAAQLLNRVMPAYPAPNPHCSAFVLGFQFLFLNKTINQ